MGRPFKKLSCNPKHNKTRKKYTCYDDNTLLILRDTWNKRHPDKKIESTENEMIWKELQQKLTECNHEICFMEKLVDSTTDREKFKNDFFAPIAPKSWNKNINEWLSSIDISNVMKQYEETYSDFKFIGPTPIDFDKKENEDTCVYQDLCNLNIKSLYDSGIRKLGVIFNLSTHHEKGSHWVSLFTDLNKGFIFYFDSCGDKIPSEIKNLVNRITNQCNQIGIKLLEDSSYKFIHQKGGTECGMYALYFIINLIEELKTREYFRTHRIPDKEVESFRHFYFNVLID
jgi:hypothetical protein